MTQEFWSVILGFVMTIVTGFIVGKTWATAVKALVAIGVSLVLGLIQCLVLGQFTIVDIAKNWTIVFAAGEALYGLYFKSLFEKSKSD
jgi:cytochrome b subunit of formate dehydrogenase